MLIDGNSLTYRAFFALPTDMATASGQVTNAVYGFTSMLVNLVKDHAPDALAITFDRPEPTFRHQRLESYKATRDKAPDILVQQMGLVRQVVDTLALPVLELSGFEADDIIATYTRRATEAGWDSIVVTGDRDSYQLVADPWVKVLYNRRGVSDYALYDEAGIIERTGVHPSKYLHYAALRGDTSDNLPGVPGVGEKTAAKLVNTYGDLDGIFAHVEEQTPKLRQNLLEHEVAARTNLELMALVFDVPLDQRIEDLHPGTIDAEALAELCKFLEFGPQMTGRIVEAFPDAAGDTLVAAVDHRVATRVAADRAADLPPGEALSLAPVWSGPLRSPTLNGVAVVVDAAASEVAWFPTVSDAELAAVAELWSERPVTGHDVKALVRTCLDRGVAPPAIALDTKIAAYLLDPADSGYALEDLLRRYTTVALAEIAEPAEPGQLNLDAVDVDESEYGCREALGVALLAPALHAALDAQGLTALHEDVEVPLISVLANMEHLGIGVDRAALTALSQELESETRRLEALVWEDAGEQFLVNSTKQLREVLYDRLGLVPQKKTKTGFSTDAQTLEKLRGQHPIIEHLLAYREVEKLRSTYGEGLLAEVRSDDRIHATFNQTVARTGRLSSDAPNLHNIPVRTAGGRRFREVFVPQGGRTFLIADYNQIELRCIAHLAADPGLISAFTSGEDIHNSTAARIFGVAPEAVSTEQRSKSKMVSYGLAYGMEAYGLGQRLNIPTGEAQQILDAYFAAFPAVKAYMDRTVAEARERGYTETLFGRRRRIPELASNNRQIRHAGERQAMNAGIQGLAADIFKVALVRLERELRAANLRADLILQIHDEVIVETPPEELDQVTTIVTDAMSGAFDLHVPLAVNLSSGDSWAAAKG
jgi:DNA polymerase-1